jgi:hypothetical protein
VTDRRLFGRNWWSDRVLRTAEIANHNGTDENESGNGGAHDSPPAPYEPHSAPVLTPPHRRT